MKIASRAADPFSGRLNADFTSIHYKESATHASYQYAFGVERLREFSDFVEFGDRGAVFAGTYVLMGGLYGAELRRLAAHNARIVVSQGLGPSIERLRRRYGDLIHVYRDGRPGFQHIKYVYAERAGRPAFRISSGPLATLDLGLIAIGSKGIGRTELFFQTTHPQICAEARCLHESLANDDIPRSGQYLLLQTPRNDDLLPAITADVERLQFGGELIHARASIEAEPEDGRSPSAETLLRLHAAIEAAIMRGVHCVILSDCPIQSTRGALRNFRRRGALASDPTLLPGCSRVGRWPLHAPLVGKWLHKRSAQEHYNVTILRGLVDTATRKRFTVVYFGTKRDVPHLEGAVDGMIRLDSREFPGLAERLQRFILHRYSAPSYAIQSGH